MFSCSATEKPSQITFAAPRRALARGRPCSGANVFNLVIELGSLVEETSSEFGVAGLLGEPQERGRLPEKIALARHSKIPGYRLCNKEL